MRLKVRNFFVGAGFYGTLLLVGYFASITLWRGSFDASGCADRRLSPLDRQREYVLSL